MLAATHLGLSLNTRDKMYPHLAWQKNEMKKKTQPIIAGVRLQSFSRRWQPANGDVAEFLS